MRLSAIGLSVKPGGSAQAIEISGGLKTHGAIAAPRIDGGCEATGGGFDQI
ncbi:MAG TPA: hypothetical protein VF739_00910 [Ktedonobacterales bacterium]